MVHEHLLATQSDTWRELLTTTPYQQLARLFLRVGRSGIFYLHAEGPNLVSGPLVGADGFLILNGKLEQVKNPILTITKQESSGGFFRWARSGTISWEATGPGSVRLETLNKLELANWLVGGASLNGVSGELAYGGQRLPIFGISEVLK